MNQATAPGKIILFGEHAVVYGRPAIAVPLTQVRATTTLSPNSTAFQVIAHDLGQRYLLTEAATDNPIAVAVNETLRQLGHPVAPSVNLGLQSTIPLGRGLGSGAAISTAIVRVLAQFYQTDLTPAEISAIVYEVEKLHHGTPSGIDNTVIAFEQPVYFIKGRGVQRMTVKKSLTFVIGDTGVIASTREVVAALRQRWQAAPDRYEGYFDEVGRLAQHAKMIIEQGLVGAAALGKLMNENHELLTDMGVSSPELDKLVLAAGDAGAWGAKLSGAGGGGNMIALVEPAQAEQVAQALRAAGAIETIITTVR